jgi:hypothetical protein
MTARTRRAANCGLAFLILLVTLLHLAATAAAASDAAFARAREPWLVIDPNRQVVDVYVAGVLLERLPVKRVSVRTWQARGAESAIDSEPAMTPGQVFTIEVPPSEITRVTRLVTVEEVAPGPTAQGDPPSSAQTPAVPAPTDVEPPPLPDSYETQLDNGFRLIVTTLDSRTSWWQSTATAMHDLWQTLRGTARAERPSLLVLEVEDEVAGRIHPLLRPGSRVTLGRSTADQPSLADQAPQP